MPIHPERRVRAVLRELITLLRESFTPKAGRFLPFDACPTKFAPPMKKADACAAHHHPAA
jgi:hypothetical protein